MNEQFKLKSLSFSQAIAVTQSLMEQINAHKLSETEIQQEVSSILDTKNGGRGFFVAYLTSPLPLADNPSIGILNGLKSSIEVSSELLVKNLAMSSAIAIVHARNGDYDSLEGSQKVCRRTGYLIQQLDSTKIKEQLRKLQDTIDTKDGEYTGFLNRWSYDTEQKKAIQTAIANILISS